MIADFLVRIFVHEEHHLFKTGIWIAEGIVGEVVHLVPAVHGVKDTGVVEIPMVDVLQMRHLVGAKFARRSEMFFEAEYQQSAVMNFSVSLMKW